MELLIQLNESPRATRICRWKTARRSTTWRSCCCRPWAPVIALGLRAGPVERLPKCTSGRSVPYLQAVAAPPIRFRERAPPPAQSPPPSLFGAAVRLDGDSRGGDQPARRDRGPAHGPSGRSIRDGRDRAHQTRRASGQCRHRHRRSFPMTPAQPCDRRLPTLLPASRFGFCTGQRRRDRSRARRLHPHPRGCLPAPRNYRQSP